MLNFGKALEYMRAGKKVCRRIWRTADPVNRNADGGPLYTLALASIFVEGGEIFAFVPPELPAEGEEPRSPLIERWKPTNADLLADDWDSA